MSLLLSFINLLIILAHQKAIDRLKVVFNTADLHDSQKTEIPRPLGDLVNGVKTNKLTNIHSSDFIQDAYLETPQLPTKEETDKALLDIRKQALMSEYGV